MANALLRGVMRKLLECILNSRQEEFQRYNRVINQQRYDKNKIYSLHEPGVLCINKGKEYKKYEFGTKSAIAMTKRSCIIVGAKSFTTNVYDGDTLKEILPQIEAMRGRVPKTAICDRGLRGRKRVGKTTVSIPGTAKPKVSAYDKIKLRKTFGRRSAIEPVIGHLKSDFRLARNYLKGVIGDTINLLLAAAAFPITDHKSHVVSPLLADF